MTKTLALVAIAASVLGGGATPASARIETAAEPWEAPQADDDLAPRDEDRGSSTFAMGIATLAGAGFLRWRRRRYLIETAAL